MIIPCIDLMGGKVVQLVKGQVKALELETVEEALEMCKDFPLIHVIDIDAAKGLGSNDGLVRKITSQRRARVGGGVRSATRARELVDQGAEQVILGSAAFGENGVDIVFLKEVGEEIGVEKVILAIDCKGGEVAIKGWESTVAMTPEQAIKEAEGLVGGFLCTYVDREGTMKGTDLELFRGLRAKSSLPLIAAGGIGKIEEVRELAEMGVDVALGMSIYTGKISLDQLREIG